MSEPGGVVEAPWPMLFAPQERLGWTYTDRDRLRRSFDEPEPDGGGPEDVTAHERAVRGKLPRRLLAAWRAAAVGAVLVLAWQLRLVQQHGHIEPSTALVSAVSAACAAGALWCLVCLFHLSLVRRFWDRRRNRHLRSLVDRAGDWSRRLAEFEQQEAARLAAVPSWYPVPVRAGVRRIDVIGGSLWGWEALLTVFGASALAARGPLLVLDLSSQMVARELVRGASASGRSVDVQLLPTELADSDLLVGIGASELTDAFIESLHGGDSVADRAERAVDTRVLSAVCEVLAPGGLSMERIAAGVRTLLGEPVRDEVLTGVERAHLADEVFSESYRDGAAASLRRIEAMAHPIGPLGRRSQARPAAQVRCVAASTLWGSAGTHFLADLVVAWAARQVATDPASVATLVVAGADEIAVRHLERLSDLCERRGVRLVVLFRHLRQTSAQVLGAGPVAFMRLGNHEEAGRAADFIGRQHRFEISQITHALGGDQSRSTSQSDGSSEGFGETAGRDRGASRSGIPGAATHSWSVSDSRSWNTERNWSKSVSAAESVTWSTSASSDRVFEHTVEPTVLQQLPDYAMVLVDHAPSGVQIQAVEVNPSIPLLLIADGFDDPTDLADGGRAPALGGAPFAAAPGMLTGPAQAAVTVAGLSAAGAEVDRKRRP